MPTAFNGQMPENPSLRLQVVDRLARVATIQLEDARGNVVGVQVTGSFSNDQAMIQVNLLRPPPPNAQLVIYLATPDTVRVVPFRIEDIPLP